MFISLIFIIYSKGVYEGQDYDVHVNATYKRNAPFDHSWIWIVKWDRLMGKPSPY